MLVDAPRSTSSHCGSEKALDQRVPVLPSVAPAAGVPAFSVEEAVVALFSATSVVPQVAAAALGAVAPSPATRTDTTSAATASRLTAARREAGADLARLRYVLLSRFCGLMGDLPVKARLVSH